MSRILEAISKVEADRLAGSASQDKEQPQPSTQNRGQDPLSQLESAVKAWDSHVDETCRRIATEVGGVGDRLRAICRAETLGKAGSAALSEAQAEIDRQARVLAHQEQALEAATQQIAQSKAERAQLHAELRELRERAARDAAAERALQAALDQVRAELLNAREQIAAARVLSAKVDELKARVDEERTRADRLEQALGQREEAEAKTRISEQLAQAFHERDEANQRVESLYAQNAMLRRVNASLTDPAKPDGLSTGRVSFEAFDAQGRRRRLGEMLVGADLITEKELAAALAQQEHVPQRPLGATLVYMGLASDAAVAKALAHQLDLPFVRVSPETVDPGAPSVVAGQLARQRMCIPIGIASDRVVLAMTNPQDLIAIDDVARASGKEVEPVVASASDVSAALARYYGTS